MAASGKRDLWKVRHQAFWNTSVEFRPTWRICAHDDCRGFVHGVDHCLAHLPDEEHEEVWDRIQLDKVNRRLVDVRGTVIDSGLLAQLVGTNDDADSAPARMPTVNFSHCRFTEHANFQNRQFEAEATFADARFEHGATFTATTFEASANFEGASFRQRATFDYATFENDANFRNASFSWTATFHGVSFRRETTFDEALVREQLAFTGASFATTTRLGPLGAKAVTFSDATFARRMVIEVSALTVDCNGAHFEAGVDMRVRYASVSLRRVRFDAASSVAGLGAPFLERVLDDAALFGTLRELRRGAEVLSLQETDVSELMLADVGLRRCLFAGAHHLDKLRLEGRTPFNQPPTGFQFRRWEFPWVWRWSSRQTLIEEHFARQGWPKSIEWERRDYTYDDVAGVLRTQDDPLIEFDRLVGLYRSLRKAFEDAKNESGAGDFYYGEMEARRHSWRTRRSERALLTAYWALSGYGQRAMRSIVALVMLFVLLTALLVGFGLPTTGPVQQMTGTVQAPPGGLGVPQQITLDVLATPPLLPPADQRWTSERTSRALRVMTGVVSFRDTEPRLTTAGTWTVIAGRLFGPLLVLLAALAIRARLKR